jgi:hypothetical protein
VIDRSSTAAVSPNNDTRASRSSEMDSTVCCGMVTPKPDLLEVERAEALLDGDPPGPVTVAGSQRHVDRAGAVLLDCERGARTRALASDRSTRCRRGCPTLWRCRRGARYADREVAELHCTPPLVSVALTAAKACTADRLEREAEVEQRPALPTDTDAEPETVTAGTRVTVLPIEVDEPEDHAGDGGRGSIQESSASSHTVTSP